MTLIRGRWLRYRIRGDLDFSEFALVFLGVRGIIVIREQALVTCSG